MKIRHSHQSSPNPCRRGRRTRRLIPTGENFATSVVKKNDAIAKLQHLSHSSRNNALATFFNRERVVIRNASPESEGIATSFFCFTTILNS